MKRILLLVCLVLAVSAFGDFVSLLVGQTANYQILMNTVGTLDMGSAATHTRLGPSDNQLQIYTDSYANTGGAYDDAINAYIYGTTGDGTGAVRAIKAIGYNADGGNYAEIYGCDILAAQNSGTHAAPAINLYNVLITDNADPDNGDRPTGYVGNFGIIDNSGGASNTNATVSGGLVGCVKDATGNAPLAGVVSFFEGDSGVSPNNPTNAYFRVMTTRTTATDIPAYGIDFNCGAAVPECRVADIQGQNLATINNLAAGSWAFDGTLSPHVHAGVADTAAQNMANINVLLMPSSVAPLAITDLTNTVVGASYILVCNGAVNPFTIADAGHFLLTGAWAGAQVGDNITVMCLDNTAGAEVFIETARADN